MILFINGCNAFEAVDSNLADKSVSDKIDNGNYAMNSGDYTKALDIFTVLAKDGNGTDAVFRGKAQAEAAKAGFNFLDALNGTQNSLSAGDSSESLFSTLKKISDFSLLNTALTDISRLSSPTNQDKLLASFLAVNMVCHRLLEKYDTNYNGKLDRNDEIDFDTNDSKTDAWPQLFADFTKSPSSQSLEQAFINAAHAFDGRGAPWKLISPINGITIDGNYSSANRLTVIAIGNMADSLELANEYFEKDATSFKNTIIQIDGNDS